MRTYAIAVVPGDGIGVEVTEAALALLDRLEARFGFSTRRRTVRAGAAFWREAGLEIEPGGFEACEAADAVFLGAIGLPDVRLPDGTEISPHLVMRDRMRLVSGIRPVRRFPNTPCPLADPRAAGIDLVIVRESTEGLFWSRGRGVVVDDREARDTLVITRPVCEELFETAFALARQRRERGRGPGLVTCVDKANVFVSMAFFRRIFDEAAARHPDLRHDHRYVDAAALDLVRRPWTFDVLVMENMFGDILSDLGGGLVGGMGMAPCAEIGREHGLFQPAHGSAPDIAGQGLANPTAAILSLAMMLDWLAATRDDSRLRDAAAALEDAVWRAFAEGAARPAELGGDQGTAAVTEAVAARLG